MKPILLCLFTQTLIHPLMAQDRWPLPDAPLRMVIPDAKAFEASLTGSYRSFLEAKPKPGDPVVAAWRKSRVGSKLEDQWSKFSESLGLDWTQIQKLQPRSMALAILQVGHLEAVLVIDTPLAQVPFKLPEGESRTQGGIPYAFVKAGAADASEDPDSRMGLAWARMGSQLILATSERALKLAIQEAQAGRGFKPPLPGLISMELDLDALRKDRYFKREFLFAEGPEKGRIHTALRQENGHLIEIREGLGAGKDEIRSGVFRFEAPGAATCGWEPEGKVFWPTFRRALLDPVPAPSDTPQPTIQSLPAAGQGSTDRYAVNFTHGRPAAAGAWEAGDLAPWQVLLAAHPIKSWGYWVDERSSHPSSRRMVFPWPKEQDTAFLECCRATAARRSNLATVSTLGEIKEIRVGPGLPALALRRTGNFLWVASAARDLEQVPTPSPEADLVRWASLDLDAVRREGPRWEKVEGPARPEQVRPLSDRVMGLLGWMPQTHSLHLERRKTPQGWREVLRFVEK